jgi:hypothetical protein
MFCVKTKLTNTNVWYIMHGPYVGYECLTNVWICGISVWIGVFGPGDYDGPP